MGPNGERGRVDRLEGEGEEVLICDWVGGKDGFLRLCVLCGWFC